MLCLRVVRIVERMRGEYSEGVFRVRLRCEFGFCLNARGIPLTRDSVLRDASVPVMLAWEQNGEELTLQHGAPLRVVVPGMYVVSQRFPNLD